MHKYFLFILFFLCQNVMRGQTLDSLIAKAIDFEGVQMDSTVHYFYKALELASPDDKGSLLTIHDGIATGLQMKGKFSEALYHGYEAIKYGRNSKDSIFIYSKLGSITSITDVHKADSLFKLAELLLNEETDSLTYQLIYSNYAIIKQRKGDLSESIDYYLKAVPYYNNDFGSAQIFQNISSVFASLGQFSRAEEYMLKAVDICEKNNYKFRNKAVAYQFAKILTELEKYEEAQKEIDLYMANNKSKFFAHSLQSKLFQKQGFWDKAYTEIQKAFPLPEGVQPELSLQVLENYANVLKQRKDFKTLDQISNQMVELGTKTGYPQYLKTSLNFQAVANSENGKFKEAFYNLKASKNLEDSIYRSQQVQNLNLLESDFKRKEQAQSIDLLNKDNQIKEVQLKQKNILLGFGLLGLAIISGLCYFLFRLFKKVKLQNGVIEKSLNEKDILLREIHHRVKNNLQLVSSLLGLQSRYVKDPSALEALNSGKSRVKSMALIHQDLYNRENLTGVDIQTYIQKLGKELIQTYKIDKNKIHFESDVQSLILDVDSLIPIGLIINEVLTNAIKYAFNDKKDGKIYLSIKEANGHLKIKVKDNGVGIDEDNKRADSFGHRLIGMLLDQLEGSIKTSNNNGAEIDIIINKYQKAS